MFHTRRYDDRQDVSMADVPVSRRLPKSMTHLFASPWHRCVHGLGLAKGLSGYDPVQAENLLEANKLLLGKSNRPYQVFYYYLLQWVLDSIDDIHTGKCRIDFDTCSHIFSALSLCDDELEYARASSLMLECFIHLGQVEMFRPQLQESLISAFERLHTAKDSSEKFQYENLHMQSNLIRVAAQAGWIELVTYCDEVSGADYVQRALDYIDNIPGYFYKVRSASLLFTVLAAIGLGHRVCAENRDYIGELMAFMHVSLDNWSGYPADGVHEDVDYQFFPLSLLLAAVAELGCTEYLHYKRDWVNLLESLFSRLSARSRASQSLFYVIALANLGILQEKVPDRDAFVQQCTDAYIECSDGTAMDDYLRANYLIHLSDYLETKQSVAPVLWEYMYKRLDQYQHNLVQDTSVAYDSGYMVMSYILAAHHLTGRLSYLFGNDKMYDVIAILARLKENAAVTAYNLPRLDYVLMDMALQLRG